MVRFMPPQETGQGFPNCVCSQMSLPSGARVQAMVLGRRGARVGWGFGTTGFFADTTGAGGVIEASSFLCREGGGEEGRCTGKSRISRSLLILSVSSDETTLSRASSKVTSAGKGNGVGLVAVRISGLWNEW